MADEPNDTRHLLSVEIPFQRILEAVLLPPAKAIGESAAEGVREIVSLLRSRLSTRRQGNLLRHLEIAQERRSERPVLPESLGQLELTFEDWADAASRIDPMGPDAAELTGIWQGLLDGILEGDALDTGLIARLRDLRQVEARLLLLFREKRVVMPKPSFRPAYERLASLGLTKSVSGFRHPFVFAMALALVGSAEPVNDFETPMSWI